MSTERKTYPADEYNFLLNKYMDLRASVKSDYVSKDMYFYLLDKYTELKK